MIEKPILDKMEIRTLFSRFLSETARYLAVYLEQVFPAITKNWWEEAVVSKLSFQQRRRVEEQKISSLYSLDLAALLRVLDQNWYEISQKKNQPYEARHFLKEMQTVRNRWAHAGTVRWFNRNGHYAKSSNLRGEVSDE